MKHCDPEILALAALGEELAAGDSQHLAGCDRCLAEVAELAELVALAKEAPQHLTPAPQGVWDAVRTQLGLSSPGEQPSAAAEARSTPDATGGAALHASAGSAIVERAGGRVVHLAARRRLVYVAAVAAVAGAIVGGATVWTALDRAATQVGQETIVAQAVLDPLASAVSEPGKAQVLETSDGLVVRIDARGLPPSTGFHEVWLLDADTTKLVSLGALPSGSVGTFTVPPGVSVADFPVVDVSLEPYDGDPGHSHDSLLRGVLEA